MIDVKQFALSLEQIAEEKKLPVETVQDAMEHALAAAYRKDYGSKEQDVRARFNKRTGDIMIFVTREVVEEVDNEDTEISLEDAQKIDEEVGVGDTVEEEVEFEEFGRVAAQTAKQVILQKLREAERDVIYEEYKDKVGQLFNGTVQRIESKVAYVELGRTQGILPRSEQIPGERYRNGQRLKIYLRDVESSTRGPQLILSRAVPEFVSLLFEQEVPEMENDAVKIESIAREAGTRTKVAVASNVPGVDPVGTFVGGHGTRVQAVMSELGDEKIDVVMHEEDPVEFITNALAPTEINDVHLDEEAEKAEVIVPDEQLSVAIGKQGQNVRLASKLTGWRIDIISASGEEVTAEDDDDTKSDSENDSQAEDEPESMEKKDGGYVPKAQLEDSLINTLDQSEEE